MSIDRASFRGHLVWILKTLTVASMSVENGQNLSYVLTEKAVGGLCVRLVAMMQIMICKHEVTWKRRVFQRYMLLLQVKNMHVECL